MAPNDTQRVDVFLSYASEDRPKAAAIVTALQMNGLAVWWDAKIQANQQFSPVIESHIDAARAVVVLWTVSSVKKSFVREEAVRGQAKLIPVLLDEAQPPLGFGQVSHVNLRRWNGDELAPDLDRLIESIGRVGKCESSWSKPAPWLVLRSLFRDLKTRIVLFVIVATLAAAWLAWGRLHWHVADTQWAILLGLLGALVWLSIRASRLARSRLGFLFAGTLGIMAVTAWAFACFTYYKTPEFPPESAGILVARFYGDPSDDTQLSWAGQLQKQKSGQSTSADEIAALSPVLIQPLRRQIRNDAHARLLMNESGALLTIWGRDDRSAAMTFANLPGFAKLDGLAISAIDSVTVNGDPKSQAVLSRSVLLFSSAYAAFRRAEYDTAHRLLQRIPGNVDTDRTVLTSEASMLATAHLLLGNIGMFAGCDKADPAQCASAIDHYLTAREIFVKDEGSRGNLFVDASNNLAVATFKLTRTYSTSLAELKDADFACQAMRGDPPLACRFVRYNLALADSEAGDYATALTTLAGVCSEQDYRQVKRAPASTFIAACHQQQAYAAAKLGEQSTSDVESDQRFDEALGYIEQAVASLPDPLPATPPPKFLITRARIAVGQGDFRKASDLLGQVVDENGLTLTKKVAEEYPELDASDITTLYTVARICTHAIKPEEARFADQLSQASSYIRGRIERCTATKESEP